MTVLLTGSAGFIGGALYKTLLDKKLIVLKFNEIDLRMVNWRDRLETFVKESQCIFHVGANASTEETNVNRLMFTNYEFSKVLFDLAAKYGKPVIFSSSASIYGNGDSVPTNLYGWTKKLAEDYGLLKVKKFIALRYFNVYGPGESHKGRGASVACQAQKHARQASEPFPLLPERPLRDFVYVNDVVDANAYAYENLDRIPSRGYDVGTGKSRPFEDVLEILGIRYKYLDKNTIPSWYQFYTQADRQAFMPGWNFSHDLEHGLAQYKLWWKNNALVARID